MPEEIYEDVYGTCEIILNDIMVYHANHALTCHERQNV